VSNKHAGTDKAQKIILTHSTSRSIDAPSRTLSPVSSAAMNSVKLVTHRDDTENGGDAGLPTSKSLPEITVTEKRKTESNNANPIGNGTNTDNRSNGFSPLSSPPAERLVLPRVNTTTSISSVRMISAEFGGTKAYSNIQISEDNSASNGGASPQQWSSAVGRANLGKSGRVIERLMGENDMLKRDLQIERLHAEEARQAVKMTEERIDAINTDYEGRLHDAAINKTLLKKRERQLADLKGHIDAERHRADEAIERERGWREAMEKMEAETKRKVEEATNYAMLMEGRYKALTSHWKEQGEVVDRAVRKLSGEISGLLQERVKDGDRLDTLQQLCNEQREALARLEDENRRIAQASEAYKAEQDASLLSIKTRTREQEKANEDALAETQKVLGELKWALGVKRNVKGAS